MEGVFAELREHLRMRSVPVEQRVARLVGRDSEILHALLDVAGLMRDDDDREESLVHTLSPLLLDALRRNPELVGYLVADS